MTETIDLIAQREAPFNELASKILELKRIVVSGVSQDNIGITQALADDIYELARTIGASYDRGGFT